MQEGGAAAAAAAVAGGCVVSQPGAAAEGLAAGGRELPASVRSVPCRLMASRGRGE